MSYRPIARQFFWMFAITCVMLGWLGAKPAEGCTSSSRASSRPCIRLLRRTVRDRIVREGRSRSPPRSRTSVLGKLKGASPVAVGAASEPNPRAEQGGRKDHDHETVFPPRPRRTDVAGASTVQPANAAGERVNPPELTWSFAGPFGRYDRAQLQRGLKVFKESCANCHSPRICSDSATLRISAIRTRR